MQYKEFSQSIFIDLNRSVSKPADLKSTKYITLALLLLLINNTQSFSQIKRIITIGSSTTAGTGATPRDSCWVGLLNRYYKCQLSIVDSLYNLGVGGEDNYRAMPTGYIPPASRPTPDVNHNVSKARFLLKDLPVAANGVVIVNFPTNNYDIYSIEEIMSSLQVIYDSATSAGNRCFITTTQPRNDFSFSTPVEKRKLADIKDSILYRFGTDNTINFWDGMYNPADTTILNDYSFGDQVHFNNAGHQDLFKRVVAKNILSLPVWYSKASGSLNALTTWGSNPDGSGNQPTSFTADYQLFNIVNNPAPTITADWIISGNNTRLMIGDGISPVNFIVPDGMKVSVTNPPVNSCF